MPRDSGFIVIVITSIQVLRAAAAARAVHDTFSTAFSGRADGELRGLGRIGGQHRKGLGRDASSGHLLVDAGPRRSPSACPEI